MKTIEVSSENLAQAVSDTTARAVEAVGKHWGPPSKFAVDRSQTGLTFDTIEGMPIEHENTITIHWPEIQESRIIYVEESTDRHGTQHHRAYVTVFHHGAMIRLYLRDIQHITSIQWKSSL